MDSLKKRIQNEQEQYVGTIFRNTANMFNNIKHEVYTKQRGRRNPEYDTIGFGDNERTTSERKGDVLYNYVAYYTFKGDSCPSKEIEKISAHSVSIEHFLEQDSVYRFYAQLDEKTKLLLAEVSKHKVQIPIYSDKEPLVQIGEVQKDEIGDTVLETIEGRMRNHEVLSKYANLIIGDIEQIMALDPESEISPRNPLQIQIASLQVAIEKLKQENGEKDEKISSLQKKLEKARKFIEVLLRNPVVKGLMGREIKKYDDDGR